MNEDSSTSLVLVIFLILMVLVSCTHPVFECLAALASEKRGLRTVSRFVSSFQQLQCFMSFSVINPYRCKAASVPACSTRIWMKLVFGLVYESGCFHVIVPCSALPA